MEITTTYSDGHDNAAAFAIHKEEAETHFAPARCECYFHDTRLNAEGKFVLATKWRALDDTPPPGIILP